MELAGGLDIMFRRTLKTRLPRGFLVSKFHTRKKGKMQCLAPCQRVSM